MAKKRKSKLVKEDNVQKDLENGFGDPEGENTFSMGFMSPGNSYYEEMLKKAASELREKKNDKSKK